ncbi:MAG: hypothetical protein ACK57R_06075 [Dolichospermum sp.]|nr:hypothetical protein [Anabaena sp. 49628_E55]
MTREQGTGNREQVTGNRLQGTGNREQRLIKYKTTNFVILITVFSIW